jgi:D-alanyl-D-alanine carboxypeptidase
LFPVFDCSPILESARRQLGCRGVLCTLSEDGRWTTFSAGNISAADHRRPYYIYSISKTFTAAAVLLLHERQGKLLDRPLRSVLPEAPIPDGITVRQVLNHTSGLSDYFDSPDYHAAVRQHPEQPWSHEKLMQVGLRGTPRFAPGQGWSYSNPGYALLRELIARLSGQDYFDFLTETICRPLGLTATRPFLAPDLSGELLEGEAPEIAGDFRRRYAPGWIAPGCLISTTEEVARFYDALFAGQVIGGESLRAMTSTIDVPVPVLAGGGIPAYGLGVMHAHQDPLGDAWGHGGGGPGYTTYVRHYPVLEGHTFTLSLVLNRTLPATPFDLADTLVRAYQASVR